MTIDPVEFSFTYTEGAADATLASDIKKVLVELRLTLWARCHRAAEEAEGEPVTPEALKVHGGLLFLPDGWMQFRWKGRPILEHSPTQTKVVEVAGTEKPTKRLVARMEFRKPPVIVL